MASLTCSSLPIFLFFMIILLSSQFNPSVGTFTGDIEHKSQIQTSCQHTDYPDVCILVLEQDPRSLKANQVQLCRIGMELAAALANDTLDYISMFLESPIGHELRHNLTYCFNSYLAAANYVLREGLSDFDDGCYRDADRIVASVTSAAGLCNANGIPPLQQRNRVLFQFSIDTSRMITTLFESPNPPSPCKNRKP